MQDTAETESPDWQGTSEDPSGPHVPDFSRSSYSRGKMTRRKNIIEVKSIVLGEQPNGSSTAHPAPSKTPKTLVPDWSYNKSSIAAASILSAIATAALLFLAVLFVKKLRRWKQTRKARKGDGLSKLPSAAERNRRRESLMFSNDDLARTFVVHQQNGAVTRVLCESTDPSTPDIGMSDSSLPLDQTDLASFNVTTDPALHLEALNAPQRVRSGSVPKQIIIVSPSVQPVAPSSVVHESRPTVPASPIQPAQRAEIVPGNYDTCDSDTTPSLPPIETSSSPTLSF